MQLLLLQVAQLFHIVLRTVGGDGKTERLFRALPSPDPFRDLSQSAQLDGFYAADAFAGCKFLLCEVHQPAEAPGRISKFQDPR